MIKNNHVRIVIATMFMLSLAEAVAIPCATGTKSLGDASLSSPISLNRLSAPRELIPPSLQGRISQRIKPLVREKASNFECDENSMCASFDSNTTPEKVSAWIGFNYVNKEGNYFIATYGQEATHLGNNVYSTPKWDKGHFWIHIGENTVPFPIQPRFVGVDKESGNEWHVVDYIGYQKPNTDYSNYWQNFSKSSLILLINPKTKKVEQYHLEYYDENDQYIGNYAIEIGDKIQSFFVGFEKEVDDVDFLLSIEKITTVTSAITFEYKEQYPGKDFNCTHCGDLDFTTVEFKYMFEEFSHQRSLFTEPKAIERKQTESTNTNNTSSSKSVPISGFWIFFILSILITMVAFKNDNQPSEV